MMIVIDKSILNIIPDFDIVALEMDVILEASDIISELITQVEEQIFEEYSLTDVLNIPLIKEARDGYKALGKDPSRYRLACESLLRRIVKGNKLYRINNLVDLGNILSIKTNRSVAVLDRERIEGDILIRLGTTDDEYYGIGRGLINVSNIPVYVDEVGPFGSTTSDTERTAISNDTKKILLFIICFSDSYKDENLELATKMYENHASAKNIRKIDVRKIYG
jgi:DNA/RNA-binding domain of Phe-tRNA-synthetase-like protein